MLSQAGIRAGFFSVNSIEILKFLSRGDFFMPPPPRFCMYILEFELPLTPIPDQLPVF